MYSQLLGTYEKKKISYIHSLSPELLFPKTKIKKLELVDRSWQIGIKVVGGVKVATEPFLDAEIILLFCVILARIMHHNVLTVEE